MTSKMPDVDSDLQGGHGAVQDKGGLSSDDARVDLAIVDGRVSPASEAAIEVTDEGLLRGDGAFEVIRLYAGRPFGLDEHLTRLGLSARKLRLEYPRDEVAKDITTLLAAAGPVDAALRFLVTRGGRRIGTVEALPALPETIGLATVEYAPIGFMRGIKSLSYAPNMLARRVARESGGDDALLVTPTGEVLEAPTSAFFYVLDGCLHTPPLASGILDSITRRHLLSVTDASERVTRREDLPLMKEAFIASTLREVHPVHAIDGLGIQGTPGPRTTEAAEGMRAHVRQALARGRAAA